MKRKVGCLIGALVPVVAFLIFIYGFDPWFRPGITTKKLTTPNPTSYIFAASMDDVQEVLHNKVVKCCGDEIEFKDDALFSGSILKSPGNEHDAYIDNFHTPLGLSEVYFSGGKALRYICEFHLHIVSISKDETRVDVIPYKPEVIKGLSWWGPHNLSPANIYVNVSPTTIEEYRIILEIGSALGAANMPPLLLPANDRIAK